MNDRIEEYRQDWAGDKSTHPKARPRKAFLLNRERPHERHFFLLLLVILISYGAYTRRDQLERIVDDWVRYEKTRTEMVAISRLMQQHIKVYGHLPGDTAAHIKGNMKHTKPQGPNCDFWGHPYHVYLEAQTLIIQSWGPDGKEGNADDVWIRAEVTLTPR